MVPAVQIITSAFLFSLGLIGPESAFATSESNFTLSLLTLTATILGTLILVSFIVSRIATWYINRHA